MSNLLHERENDPQLEKFLHDNAAKFHGHCLLALKLMYSGIRLYESKAVSEYGISGRRLRELHNAMPLIVKKEWMKDSNDKRTHVEYYIQIITPTKQKSIEWATNLLNNLSQSTLF